MRSFLIALMLLTLSTYASYSAAQKNHQESQWQVGIGVGGQLLNDYRGANQAHLKAIPVPFLLHNGKFLKINRDGARGEFFNSRNVQLDISAEAALNGNSEDNNARKGMPELDSAAELGPSLSIRLSGPDLSDGWSLRLPVRAVFTVSSSGMEHQGYVFNPRFNWRKPEAIGRWNLSFTAGALWGNRDIHDYYYSVDTAYATVDRPFYQASGGYSGSYSKFAIGTKLDDWLIRAYIRYDNLAGATFIDSPLVKTKHYGAFGFGVGKTFWHF